MLDSGMPGMAHISTPRGPVQLTSVSPKVQYSIEEHDTALAELSRKAGAATEGVVLRVNESFASFRAELNDLAGGQASSRVMLLSHNAQRAQLAVELQTSLSTVGHGQFAAGADKDQKLESVSKGLRNLVGLCAFAADLLNKAHAAAVEEGKANKPSAHDQLLTALGVAVPTHVPDAPPGGQAIGSPPASIPTPS
jgi:hypothetical protein